MSRTQDIKQKNWKPGPGLKNMTLNSFLCVLCFVFLVLCSSSFVMAASWSPEEVIRGYLMTNYPWEEIEVSNVKSLGRLPVSAPEKIIVQKGPIGKSVFEFIYRSDKNIMVKANVQAFDQIVKSRRPFKKGHVVDQSDLYIARMNIRKMPKSAMKNPDEIIGKSLRRSVVANIPLVEGMIEHSQVVKRGKRIVIVINHNGLNITAAGKTKEKGYVGKVVKAVNISSRKVITGILIDENTVKVEL